MMHDVLASSGLAIFAEVGLIVFLAVFVIAAVRVLRRPQADYDALARMPLDDESAGGTTERGGLKEQRRPAT